MSEPNQDSQTSQDILQACIQDSNERKTTEQPTKTAENKQPTQIRSPKPSNTPPKHVFKHFTKQNLTEKRTPIISSKLHTIALTLDLWRKEKKDIGLFINDKEKGTNKKSINSWDSPEDETNKELRPILVRPMYKQLQVPPKPFVFSSWCFSRRWCWEVFCLAWLGFAFRKPRKKKYSLKDLKAL